MKQSIQKFIDTLSQKLIVQTKDSETAQLEAWWILEKLTNKSKIQLLLEKEIELSQEQEVTLNQWISQRVDQHKPLQYILGSVPFCDLEILVEPPILIPRPETEEWVSELINKLSDFTNKPTPRLRLTSKPIKVLDMCTGTGCIGIALAKAFPKSNVIGIDINKDAITLAEKNKAHSNITNITFLESDLYEKLSGKTFDLIVSNPPYITYKDYEQLEKSVKDWEDKRALFAEEEGLKVYKQIIADAHNFLNKNSDVSQSLVLELGIGQADAVKKLLEKNNFKDIKVFKDLSGIERWIIGSTISL